MVFSNESALRIMWPKYYSFIKLHKPLCHDKAVIMRATEDEMIGWHHRFNEHKLGPTPGDGEGQGGLMCYSPWVCKELDTTE